MADGNGPGLAGLIEQHGRAGIVGRLLDKSAESTETDEVNADDGRMLEDALGRFRPMQLAQDRLPEAMSELTEIRKQTEQSANEIMELAEKLMDRSAEDAIGILEACTFQDIVGQRIGKVVAILENVGVRLEGLIAETGVADNDNFADDDELKAERRAKEQILHGPQLDGEGISQDEIDALLGA